MGLTEFDFWNMTLAEFDRFVNSKRRRKEVEAQERAYYDWVLGELFGRSIARIYSNSAKYPEIYDAYPNIFKKDEIENKRQEYKNELSVKALQQFAKSFNEKFKTKEVSKEE